MVADETQAAYELITEHLSAVQEELVAHAAELPANWDPSQDAGEAGKVLRQWLEGHLQALRDQAWETGSYTVDDYEADRESLGSLWRIDWTALGARLLRETGVESTVPSPTGLAYTIAFVRENQGDEGHNITLYGVYDSEEEAATVMNEDGRIEAVAADTDPNLSTLLEVEVWVINKTF